MYVEKGRVPSFKPIQRQEEQEKEQEKEEVFYHPGPMELREARIEIAQYSIPLSTIR